MAGETVFNTASLKKAKVEMPKTYLEMVLLKDLLDAIDIHMRSDCITNGTLELMTGCLSSQFDRFEAEAGRKQCIVGQGTSTFRSRGISSKLPFRR